MKNLYNKIYKKIGAIIYYRCPRWRDIMCDKMYLQQYYAQRMGYYMDFDNPKTFSEKLQWLKLYDRKSIYNVMADKVESKKWVAEKIGEKYIIPTLAVCDSFDQIDIEGLPKQFVLKCSHDSGSVIICRDKSSFNFNEARRKMNAALKKNWYRIGREWAYKDVKPRILVEQYMKDDNSKELTDYKFYCFNGVPKFLYVSNGLSDHSKAYINYMTIDWKRAPFHRPDYPESKTIPTKPVNYDLMLSFCEVLSKNIPFLRVDFYEINNKLYYSELTFYPGCGMTPFEPIEWDRKCGDMLVIPKK